MKWNTTLLPYKEYAIYLMVFISLVILSPPCNFFLSDMQYWKDWMSIIQLNGIGAGYDNGADYMPLFMYVLYFMGKIYGNLDRFFVEVYIFKGVVLIFDFLIVLFFIHTLFKNRNRSQYFMAIFLNIAFLFNTFLWGQVDAIYTFFAILSIYFVYYNKPIAAFVFLLISINMKLQGVIFAPLVVLIWLNQYRNKYFYKKSLYALCVALFVQFLIVLPFLSHHTLDKVIHTVLHSSGYYPVVSMNAFNMWMFVFPWKHHLELMHVSNGLLFSGITYKNWGLLLFFLSSFLVLLPVFLSVFNKSNFRNVFTIDTIWLVAILLSINFFYFNTEMHERYIHPAVVLGLVYTLYKRDYLFYFLLSLSYCLNLEKCLHYLALKNYNTLIFDHRFVALLWTIVLLRFYSNYLKIILKSRKLETI